LKFVTPKGKVVYGGGGIIPDVFVPIGSNQEEAIESMDETYQFFARFIFEHLEEDRTRYEGYTQNEFLDEFRVDDILFDNFIQFVLDRKIKLDFYAYEDKIKAYLKANIAEQLFSPNVSAQIKGDYDSMLQRVKELDKADIEASQLGAVEMKP
ncbi:MAG: peptidase S41, partial [Muricauda sp.]|nr:peptidase S41 [Allomuricauda sp.]